MGQHEPGKDLGLDEPRENVAVLLGPFTVQNHTQMAVVTEEPQIVHRQPSRHRGL